MSLNVRPCVIYMVYCSTATDVKEHGLGGTRNETSQFRDMPIQSPVLNITAYKGEVEDFGGQDSPEQLDIAWVRDNKTFDRTYMELYGKCQNTGVGRY